MQTGAITQTLLDAQDIHLAADFRGLTERRGATPRTTRPPPHDFLLVCALPDLTPEFLPADRTS